MVVRQEEAIEIHPILQRLRTNPVTTPEYGWFSNSGKFTRFCNGYGPIRLRRRNMVGSAIRED
ncbi:MAG: hypothetical protein ACTSQI_21890 [Candidatus Helarchaeota archaeon]